MNEKYQIKPISIEKVCRLCMSENSEKGFKSIYQSKIIIMIQYCSSLRVEKTDGMPSLICISCLNNLNKFWKFKKKIERVDKDLKQYLVKVGSKQNILAIAVDEAQIKDAIDESNADTSCNDVIDSNTQSDMENILNYYNQNILSVNDEYRKSQVKEMRVHDEKNISQKPEEDGLTISENGDHETVDIICTRSLDVKSDTVLAGATVALLEEPPPLVPIKISPKKDLKSAIDEGSSLKPKIEKQNKKDISSISLFCNICRKEFKERKKLIGHLKGHMVSKDFSCKICGKRYPNPSTFQIHMRSHTGERPFKCPVCNKGFTRWAGVVSHLPTHDDKRPFKCETCGKSFKISSNLERHKVLHSDILPFCCNYCGKTFSQSDNLQLHIRTYHTNEKPYLCSQCGNRFVSSTRLTRHMWVHTGYKPFHCSSCSKAYSNSSDLKNHEQVVHGDGKKEIPLACHICDKRFFHLCRLIRHLKTHQRPFACENCGKAFSSNAILEKHLASKHPLKD